MMIDRGNGAGDERQVPSGTAPSYSGDFQLFVVSPGGTWDPSLPVAAARAGGVGLLDLTHLDDASRVEVAVDRLNRLSRGSKGLVVHGRMGAAEVAAHRAVADPDVVVLTREATADVDDVARRWGEVARRVGMVVTNRDEYDVAIRTGLDFVVAKGHEAGGLVGEETTFILLQRLLRLESGIPVYAWGGIGLNTASACKIAGAAGVVLDWQLSLVRESPLPGKMRHRIENMDGSETVLVSGPRGKQLRFYHQPGMSAKEHLEEAVGTLSGEPETEDSEAAWHKTIVSLMDVGAVEERLWPIGQDACLASMWAAKAPTVGRALAMLRAHVDRAVDRCVDDTSFGVNAPLARSHGTTFPIVQGPMTRVSDVPEFCDAVERGGGLPILALGLMRNGEVRNLLARAREVMGDRPWGVGILGFVPPELHNEQLAVIEDIRPPFAVIAGGRSDQAGRLETMGIRTYLHVPSPGMLEVFVEEGARRFIFEGRECGGHVGPRSSFVLWETAIHHLAEAKLAEEEVSEIHVLFAGGICDGLGGAMISALAQPLVARGMKVGVVLGTAYLFTHEAVATGAILDTYQRVALDTTQTVLIESGLGHAVRCVPNPYTDRFELEKTRLESQGKSPEETRDELERANVGRLRIAAKGIQRAAPPSSGSVGSFVRVNESDQQREGMYLIGQVAPLCGATCSIRQLHERVCDGTTARLAAAKKQRAPVRLVESANPAPPPLDIAIVGMSCLLPAAESPEEFWHNILEKRDVLERVPSDRFDINRWYDPDGGARDKICATSGGFLKAIPFDPLKYGIPPTSMRSIEPIQLLALELVDRALRDAGFGGYDGDGLVKERTSIILGAGGGAGELSTKYVLRAALPQYFTDFDMSLLGELPEWTEDSFAGILMNVIAGRVANRFDFGGVNFTVDAACASSLAAIYVACRELTCGTSDMVIAGGCDTGQTPFGYLCFCSSGAMSPRGKSRAFDATADGIAISEGLAAVVLKRMEDAERAGDRIYAVIRAAAGGSDGRSMGMTAPRSEGQIRTFSRAYAQARFSPASVELFEAHATGTAVGDRTECQSLSKVLQQHEAAIHNSAIGSVKSNIGHTKCTAGVAGLMKAALALHHRVLPPTIHVESLDPNGPLVDGPLYVNTELRPWVRSTTPRRAAVSAFGFGGTNLHVVLEDYEGDALGARKEPAHGVWPAELFLFTAESKSRLAGRVRQFANGLEAGQAAGAEIRLPDLAYTLYRQVNARAAVRAGLVASDVGQLLKHLASLAQALTASDTSGVRLPDGVWFVDDPLGAGSPLAMLFPGQGSQWPDMIRDLAVEFAEVRDCFERADALLRGEYDRPLSRFVFPVPTFNQNEKSSQSEALKATDVAQPALGASAVGVLQLLTSLGIRPEITAGHSYGELVALHAAGSIDERSLYLLSQARGRAMADVARQSGNGDLGSMVAVQGDEHTVRALIKPCGEVWVANLNSPRQTVISGSTPGLARAVKVLESEGLSCTSIPVACAFHTSIVAPAKESFEQALRNTTVRPPRIPVFANSRACPYPETPDAIRQVLAEQILNPVRFVELINNIYESGSRIFLEVGPNDVLSRLVRAILSDRPHVAITTQPRGEPGITSLLKALGQLFVHGVSMDLERLFEPRQPHASDLGKSTGGSEKQRDSRLWLVDGAHARPANEPLQNGGPARFAVVRSSETRAATSPKAIDVTPASSAAAGSTVDGQGSAEDPYAQFQKTMRQFLSTQQAVMSSFFGSNGAPIPLDHDYVEPRTLPGDAPTGGEPETVEPATVMPPSETAPKPEPAQPDADLDLESCDFEAILNGIVSGRTGYPPDMLELDINLESELGIDSIKRIEIITAFRRAVLPSMVEPPSWFMERMTAAKTMRGILDGVRELTVESNRPTVVKAATEPVASAAVPEEPSAETSPRCVVEVVEAPCNDRSDAAPPDGVVVVTDDGHGIARTLADEWIGAAVETLNAKALLSRERANEAIEEIRRQHGEIAGVVHLQALRPAPSFPRIDQTEWTSHTEAEVKSALYLLQAMEPELKQGTFFACVSCGGADFEAVAEKEAAHAWRGGLVGMLKCAAKEWPKSRLRVIDMDTPLDSLPHVLCREWQAEGPVEVGYRNGLRLVARAVRADHEGMEGRSSLIDSDSVVMITGGARGITAQVAIEFAQRAQPTLVLLGRSPRPDGAEDQATAGIHDPSEIRKVLLAQAREAGRKDAPRDIEAKLRMLLAQREIRQTLSAVSEAGATVVYEPCDVRNAEALKRIVRTVQQRHGPINAVVHGAGVIEDKYIVDKTPESFDRVVETKVNPVLTLTQLLDPSQIKLFMLFSSMAGFYGNPGQCDYAAANETLNRLARRLHRLWPGKVVAMNWGPWSGAGMVTPEVARQFVSRGIGMIPVAAGRRAAWLETFRSDEDNANVLLGPGPWVAGADEETRLELAGKAN